MQSKPRSDADAETRFVACNDQSDDALAFDKQTVVMCDGSCANAPVSVCLCVVARRRLTMARGTGVGGGGVLSGIVARAVAFKTLEAMQFAAVTTLLPPGMPNICAGALQEGYQRAIRRPAVRDAVWPQQGESRARQPYGSTTATVVTLTATGRLQSAEIGNTQFALVRRMGGAYETTYLSQDHRYASQPSTNTQVGLQPPTHFFEPSAGVFGNCLDIAVLEDDIVVAATDGFWDVYADDYEQRRSALTAEVNAAHAAWLQAPASYSFVEHLGCLLAQRYSHQPRDDGTIFVGGVVFTALGDAASNCVFQSSQLEQAAVRAGVKYSVVHIPRRASGAPRDPRPARDSPAAKRAASPARDSPAAKRAASPARERPAAKRPRASVCSPASGGPVHARHALRAPQPCKFYALNRCRFGSACRNTH